MDSRSGVDDLIGGVVRRQMLAALVGAVVVVMRQESCQHPA